MIPKRKKDRARSSTRKAESAENDGILPSFPRESFKKIQARCDQPPRAGLFRGKYLRLARKSKARVFGRKKSAVRSVVPHGVRVSPISAAKVFITRAESMNRRRVGEISLAPEESNQSMTFTPQFSKWRAQCGDYSTAGSRSR